MPTQLRRCCPTCCEHTTSVVPEGDGWRIEMVVASAGWLRELMLRLGAEAKVLSPPDWVGIGAVAAAELLARYEPERP
ncbi:MAG: hypothetical protein WCK21_05565 [Actinomycetota bacterium]